MIDTLRTMLQPNGLHLRGVLHFGNGEGPSLQSGGTATTLVLLGNVGGSIWAPFRDWQKSQADGGGSNPLDRWSEQVIRLIAAELGATAYFPSDQPWWPFQQWAISAERLETSPLGLLVHPEYGPWHGYRGALGFNEHLPVSSGASPDTGVCAACDAKLCTKNCPVGAISVAGFDVAACRAYLATPEGQASCMMTGCVARNACPVGSGYRYPAEQLAFHMAALDI